MYSSPAWVDSVDTEDELNKYVARSKQLVSVDTVIDELYFVTISDKLYLKKIQKYKEDNF